MSGALTQAGPQAAALAEQYDTWTPEQVALIRAQLLGNKGSMDELSLLLHQATRTGLDPLARQIYGIFRYDKQVGEKMTIQVGIDGFRSIAEKTGELDGSTVEWCGKDGVWTDVWRGDGYPFAAKCTVWRKGCSHPFVGVARWDEYVQTVRGKVSHMWDKMATNMIAKCAEALALRRAYPMQLGGLYTDDEMAQAGPVMNPLNEVHADAGAVGVTNEAPPVADAPAPTATVKPTPDPTKVNAGVALRERTVELPPVDSVQIKEIAKKTKAVCAISGKPLGEVGDKFAYAQWNGGHWMARQDEYLKHVPVEDEDAIEAEFEEVPNEKVAEEDGKGLVREALAGTPAGRLVDELAGPEAEETPAQEGFDDDVPN